MSGSNGGADERTNICADERADGFSNICAIICANSGSNFGTDCVSDICPDRGTDGSTDGGMRVQRGGM